MAAILRFLEGPSSRGQLMNRAGTISDGGAVFDMFGCPSNAAAKLRH
jgi:hypothetical protein